MIEAEALQWLIVMQAVAPGRGFLRHSYRADSPLPHKKHGLAVRRETWTR